MWLMWCSLTPMVNWRPGVESIFLCERLWLNLSANVVHHCATLARQSIDWHKPEACAPSLWLMLENTHSSSIMSEDLASIRNSARIHITPGINAGLWLCPLRLIYSYTEYCEGDGFFSSFFIKGTLTLNMPAFRQYSMRKVVCQMWCSYYLMMPWERIC